MDIYDKPPLSVYLRHYSKPSLEEYLAHHGIKGQKWGERRGPPYPLTAAQKKGGVSEKAVAKSGQGGKLSQETLRACLESLRTRSDSGFSVTLCYSALKYIQYSFGFMP